MADFNLYGKGIDDGWAVEDAARLEADTHFQADVAIIGTGAGGGTTAQNGRASCRERVSIDV